ncbi:host-nuclease inhibitor Gam family protein, partial [Kingella kingae]|uniref:host-nuclease inhibitor Gam family protein n=1 Tax=Kingella kingae TaxID=504 RepID=UPI0025549DA3
MKQHKTLTTALTALAKLEKRKAELENKHCAKVAELENKHAASVEPLEAEMNTIRTAIAAYANAHREELTENGKVKSVKIGSGCLKWQKNLSLIHIS